MPALTKQYFRAGHWGQCLELLGHLCQYSESILLVSGAPGAGKSTLKQALIQQETENFAFCEIEATPHLDAENLVAIIEGKLDQPADKDLALMIDDAQNLSINVMAVLLQLKRRPDIQQHLHIVLFANQDFEQKLINSVLKEDFSEMVHVIELEPLTLSELESFLSQQFNLILDKANYKKIFAQTSGIPAKVEKIAQDYINGKRTLMSEKKSKTPIVIGSIVSAGLVFCFLALLWPEAEDKISPTQTLASVAPIMNQDPETTAQSPSNAVDEQTAAQNNEQQDEEKQQQVTTDADNSQEIEQVLTPEPEVVQLTVDQQKIASLEKQLSELQQMLVQEQQARVKLEEKIREIKAVANTKPAPRTITKSNSNPKLKKIIKSKAKIRSYNNDERYILGVASKNYTLQLFGSDNLSKVQAFMRQNDLGPQMHMFKTSYQSKPWYVLIYGNYTTREAAVGAIDRLPIDVKKLRPWPREYARIQSSIKNEG